jgi:hypothetical protein
MVRFRQCLPMFQPRPVLELPAVIAAAVLPEKPAFLSRERDPDFLTHPYRDCTPAPGGTGSSYLRPPMRCCQTYLVSPL